MTSSLDHLKISRLEVSSKINEQIQPYESLVQESFRCCLKGEDPDGKTITKIIAIGASVDNQPVGIALGSLSKNISSNPYKSMASAFLLEINYLFVQPEYRNQHIGRSLLAKMQEEVESEVLPGSELTSSFVYSLDEPSTGAIEKIIAANRWGGVRPFMLSCCFDESVFDVPLVKLSYPEGFKDFPWNELKEDERQELKKLEEIKVFYHVVSPFNDEARIDHSISRGLRYQGHVVGWLITHRIDPDTIRYSAMYIERDLPTMSLAPPLIYNVIQKHSKNLSKRILIEVPLLYVASQWVEFIEKMFVPYAYQVTRSMQAWNFTTT